MLWDYLVGHSWRLNVRNQNNNEADGGESQVRPFRGDVDYLEQSGESCPLASFERRIMKELWITIRIKFFGWLHRLASNQLDKAFDEWAGSRELRGEFWSNSNIHVDYNSIFVWSN
jgi:hypothetical protein